MGQMEPCMPGTGPRPLQSSLPPCTLGLGPREPVAALSHQPWGPLLLPCAGIESQGPSTTLSHLCTPGLGPGAASPLPAHAPSQIPPALGLRPRAQHHHCPDLNAGIRLLIQHVGLRSLHGSGNLAAEERCYRSPAAKFLGL